MVGEMKCGERESECECENENERWLKLLASSVIWMYLRNYDNLFMI